MMRHRLINAGVPLAVKWMYWGVIAIIVGGWLFIIAVIIKVKIAEGARAWVVVPTVLGIFAAGVAIYGWAFDLFWRGLDGLETVMTKRWGGLGSIVFFGLLLAAFVITVWGSSP